MKDKPVCVIITGRPGAGKTTLAYRLKENLWMPVVSRDEIKEGYVHTRGIAHDELPADTNHVVTEIFFNTVRHYLENQVSIIIEAAFQHPLWASRVASINLLSHPLLIICTLDGEEAEQRVIQRGLKDNRRQFFHGDPVVSEYRERKKPGFARPYIPPDLDIPTIHVATSMSYDPALADIVNYIQAFRRGI